MPSTFTSNTGIELLADGEQAGAWGQTTNDNFDIVDRALNGSVSIALSGTTHTLTTSNGVLSDGQAAVLVFTGSPSGTNTVTIAPNTAQKTYFVTNSTAQTVVLSQGSGANVSVPAGLSKIVFTNGDGATAAVFDITNTLSGNLTGNVTGNVTGNADTATALQTARTIGGVSFNGTTNINLPGVNIGGNQNTTGNAATATAWQTARTLTINGAGKSVNGTANVAWTLAEIGAADRLLVLTAGAGITGGGDLTENRTISIQEASAAEATAGTSSERVITPRRVTAAAWPVGATFVQFPGETAPSTLLGGSWARRFETEGVFFRTEGGEASAFASGIQGDQMQRITATGVGSSNRGFNSLSIGGAFRAGDTTDGSLSTTSSPGGRLINFDSGFSPNARVSSATSGETRPRNRTIRVWRRTA